MDDVLAKLHRTATHLAQAHGCSADIEFAQRVPAVHNAPSWMDAVRPSLAGVVGPDRLYEMPPTLGYDDVSIFLNAYGGVYVFLGVQDCEVRDGEPYPLPGGRGVWTNHSPRFYLDEGELTTGVRLHTRVALDYLHVYRRLHGLEFTALALANVYGPRQDPHGEAGVVAIFAGLLLSGSPCTIFGDGEATRDYVYVDDVVDAFARAATAGSENLYNIGTGQETSVNALYAAMAANEGVTDPPTYAAARPGELDRSCLDAGKARRELGWSPQVTLEDGVKAVLDWSRSR